MHDIDGAAVRSDAAEDLTQAEFRALRHGIAQHILGQQSLVQRLLTALLADGHLLVEGAPGVAKTSAVKALAAGLEADFHRVQFTPDLLPADLTGTEVYHPEDGSFRFDRGPLFHNVLLADEINRAPAKVQSALLEAMAERQVTVGRASFALPSLFLVMATQNPIEQEGTYPLPEAQLDRFLMHVRVGYPDFETEKAILALTRAEALQPDGGGTTRRLSQALVFEARRRVLSQYMAPQLEDYLVHLVLATRDPGRYSASLEGWLRCGTSPRASMALDRCARAHAWLCGRDFVTPEDIQTIAPDCLRHRLLLDFEAEADGRRVDEFIELLLQLVPIP